MFLSWSNRPPKTVEEFEIILNNSLRNRLQMHKSASRCLISTIDLSQPVMLSDRLITHQPSDEIITEKYLRICDI